MVETHRVLSEPVKAREYSGKHGTLVVWKFQLEGLGEVELHKKLGNQPPASGSSVLVEDSWSGEFNGSPFTRIKLAAEGRPQNGSQASSDDYSRRPDHPDNVARMRHTTALMAAPKYIEQMLTIGVIEQPKSKADYLNLVSGVVAWVESTYVPAPVSQSDVPADDADFKQQPVLDESDVPWEPARG